MAIHQIKYKPEFCKTLIDVLKKGRGVVSFCAKVGIAESTFYEWVKVYPDLKDTYELAKTYSRAWWDDKAIDALDDKTINPNTLRLNLQNRCGWSDKVQSDNTHTINSHEEALKELAK